tara:strand:- start:16923 stop:18425 length:1503 start_codon:yes stop_codon:yes gene_type:complete
MAKSNWSGGSGWNAINDPTGLLTGRVLVTTPGQTQYVEDYLLQLVGTTTNFTAQHYAVVMNYAFPSFVETTTFSGASLGLVSRASGLSTTTPITASNCYIGRISPKDGSAEIVRRNNGEDEVIASSILPSSTFSFGSLHTMRLNTFGTSPVTVQFLVDDEVLVNVGDSSSSALTTGYSGIQMQGGTAYCDNFTVLEYSSSGGSTGITPDQFYDTPTDQTSTFLLLWFKTDVGLTTQGSGTSEVVLDWADQADYVSKAYSIGQSNTSSRPSISTNTPNGSKAVVFTNDKGNFLIGPAATKLDINGSSFHNGVGLFAVIFFPTSGVLGDPTNDTSGANDTRAPLGNYGRSYQFYAINSIGSGTTFDKALQFDVHTASSKKDNAITLGSWAIINYNGFGTSTNPASVYLNGTLVGTVGSYQTTNTDMSDTGRVFHLGRRPFTDTDPNHLFGTFAITEYILVQIGNTGMTTTIRQKTEGYLAWKYSLQGNLPSDHPYKSAPPTS